MTRAVATIVLALAAWLATGAVAHAQSVSGALYRVFLADGTALASFGEWARVDDRLVFSMPLNAEQIDGQLHLVSLPANRVDWARTEEYADGVRAAQYAATRGEADFARLSADVARTINEVALVTDPAQRLVMAERARRSLIDWPGGRYGYKASEVREIVGVLDEVISDLRVSAGWGRFDLELSATTPPPPGGPLLPAPTQQDLIDHLVTASSLVTTPAERVSLLQTIVGLLDRAVNALPESWAARVRTSALGGIAEEQRLDRSYQALSSRTLSTAVGYARRADVRSLERLRAVVLQQDEKLGQKRPSDVAALLATIEAHLESAHRLRLAQDQWLIRLEQLQAYQKSAAGPIDSLAGAKSALDDIRALAGPVPSLLRPLIDRLSRDARRMAMLDAPAELAAVHAILRSACELAANAAVLRLDAATHADLSLAHRASAAAAGAMMLLARGQEEMKSAMQSPMALAAAAAARRPPAGQ